MTQAYTAPENTLLISCHLSPLHIHPAALKALPFSHKQRWYVAFDYTQVVKLVIHLHTVLYLCCGFCSVPADTVSCPPASSRYGVNKQKDPPLPRAQISRSGNLLLPVQQAVEKPCVTGALWESMDLHSRVP